VEGPVRLRRGARSWEVVDLTYSGAPLGPEHHVIEAWQSSEGFTLSVAAALSYKRTTALLVRITSDDPQEPGVGLRLDPATLVAADGTRSKQTQFAFQSSGAPAGFLGFERVAGRPSALLLPVHREGDGKSWTFEVRF